MFSRPMPNLLASILFVQGSIAGYVLTDDYSGDKFFGGFTAFTGTDPTTGFVQYLDYNHATSSKLIGSVSGASFIGVDSTSQSAQGRASVRISSVKSYNKGLVIGDFAHVPDGTCGVWPAFWMVGPNWPQHGEVDIYEGVNAATTNQMTLHTSPNCSISNNTGSFSGHASTTNCDGNAPGQSTNAGCAISNPNTNSYGAGFNAIGGGIFAMEWTSQAISIYAFPRGSIPADISAGSLNVSSWGTPVGRFGNEGCDIDDHFSDMQIVLNTDFCGQWAGKVWTSDTTCAGKAATCEAYVQNNPGAFAGSYWLVNSIRVYQQGS